MAKKLWTPEELEFIEDHRSLYEDDTKPFYSIERDLKARGASNSLISRLILSLGYIRGMSFTICLIKFSRRLTLKMQGYEGYLISLPLPNSRPDYNPEEVYRDDIYTVLVTAGFNEEVSQSISNSKILEL
jgi:hypothetical protein